MIGRVEVSDCEIADAVSATEGEMLRLLSRLVEASTSVAWEHSFERVREGRRAIRLLEPTAA
jgi:hypothetical protein